MATGRPSKLNAATQKSITDALELGVYPETAAQAAGISKATFYRWLDRGEAELQRLEDGEPATKSETAYLTFRDAVKEALAKNEVELVRALRTLPNRWQGIAWLLERRHRDRWAQTIRVEDEGTSAVDQFLKSQGV